MQQPNIMQKTLTKVKSEGRLGARPTNICAAPFIEAFAELKT
jgi:hypothetical protein